MHIWSYNFFLSKYLSILIIKLLTPIHLIFSTPIIFFTQKVIILVYSLIRYCIQKDSFFYDKVDGIKISKFFCDISGDILSLFCFLIYLEIIVFKKWDHDIEENITERSSIEYNAFNQIPDETIIDDGEIEEEEENEEEEKNIVKKNLKNQ